MIPVPEDMRAAGPSPGPAGRIVLVNPRGYRFIGDSSLPLALIYSAIHLHREYQVVIIDLRFTVDWRRRLRHELALAPVGVAITSMTGKQIASALEVSRFVKKHSRVPVIWGGIHPTLIPQTTIAHPDVDLVVCGEGEETFRDLIGALARGEPVQGIPGVWSKAKGAVVPGGRRAFIDLDALPEIPYELVDLERHIADGPRGRTISLVTSRGCPEACRFCYNTAASDRRWRGFKPERVLAEIAFFVEKYRVRHVLIHDDNFFVDLQRVQAVAEGILSRGWGITWEVIGVHPRIMAQVSETEWAFLETSGLTGIAVGAESGRQETIDFIAKNYRVEDLIAGNRRLARTGIVPTYCFISGWPGETVDQVRQIVELMFALKRDNPHTVYGTIRPLIVYPGTGMFDYALAHGYVPPARLEDWAGFAWFNYLDLSIPWTTRDRRRWLINCYYSTVLMNPEYVFVRSWVFKLLARIISPIAAWRVRHLEFRCCILARIMLFIQRRLM